MPKILSACCGLALAVVISACSPNGSIDIAKGQKAAPGIVDIPIAYVKRTLPPANKDDLRNMRTFFVSADVFVKDRADASAAERNITTRVTGTGTGAGQWDASSLDVSADGSKLVFALRGPMVPNAKEEQQPKWAIWEYTFATDQLHRIIGSDVVAAEGHDVEPHYLPDGRILFSSTRQRQSKAVLLDEGKPQFEAQTEDRREPAFVLHVMNADGTDIHQISFNASHDLAPTVLSNGRIIWSRWDHAPGRDGIHLYSANPDGTGLQLHYGAVSHMTGYNNTEIHFTQAHEMQSGNLLVLARPYTDDQFGGDLLIVDAKTYVENTQPMLASGSLLGPAQSKATGDDIRTIPALSPGGMFSSAYPLWDGSGRILVSWTQCRAVVAGQVVPCSNAALADPTATRAPPLYSLWMYDTQTQSQLPLMTPQANVMITDAVVAQARSLPVVILDKVPGVDVDAALAGEGVGVLDVRSVYDIAGVDTAAPNISTLANPALRTAAQRPARFIRLEKPVSLPDKKVLDFRNTAFGASNFMREILAYAPVEPDGSVRMKVPANVAFQISVLDRQGRRISAPHRAWLQVRPGEVLSCNGCHVRAATNPKVHGRQGLFAAAWAGASSNVFPATDPTLTAQTGETMAQIRARISCAIPGLNRCSSMQPSVDVLYDDVWTNPAVAGRTKDASFGYRYADLTTTAPTNATCRTQWSALCRITIHYAAMIHPLWSKPRVTFAADGVTVLSDRTCTRCHSPKDAANVVRVPAGQLDLSDGPSALEPDHLNSYQELLFTHNAQTVNMGALQDILVTIGIDPVTGQPIQAPVPVPPSLSAGSALGSTRFFSRFDAGGSHAGDLSPAELRLLAEWVDIGAQYFNNPFVAPLN